MKTTYDKKADALYIYFQSGKKKVSRTVKLNNYLFVDIGTQGKIYGIEILDTSSHLPVQSFLKQKKSSAKTKRRKSTAWRQSKKQ